MQRVSRGWDQHHCTSRPCLLTRPAMISVVTAKALKELDVPCQIIADAAVASAMEEVDLVLLGGEAVTENGGLVSQVSDASLCPRWLLKRLLAASALMAEGHVSSGAGSKSSRQAVRCGG